MGSMIKNGGLEKNIRCKKKYVTDWLKYTHLFHISKKNMVRVKKIYGLYDCVFKKYGTVWLKYMLFETQLKKIWYSFIFIYD